MHARDTRRPLARLALLLALAAPAAAQLDADFTATPTSGTNPLVVQFTDLTTGGTPSARSWSFGDGTTGTAANPVHLYDAPGTYTVSLTVFGSPPSILDTETKAAFITVAPATVVPDFVASPTTGFGDLDVTFTNTTTGGPITGWLWDFGDNQTSTAQHPVHHYAGPGSYDVTLTAFVGEQSESAAKPGLVTVNGFLTAAYLTTDLERISEMVAADLDGDGDEDLVTVDESADEAAWFENDDDALPGSEWPKALLATDPVVNDPSALAVADLDGDALPDVVVGDATKIAWWRNAGGGVLHGPFLATELTGRVESLGAADLDGDGDRDLFASATLTGTFQWFENLDGAGDFGPLQPLTGLTFVRSVTSADIDGDGDLDLAGTSFGDDAVGWFENLDGAGTFAAAQLVPLLQPDALRVADLDGDGDADLAVTAIQTTQGLYWFENTDGAGTFGAAQQVDDSEGWEDVDVGDVDGDGDLDLFVADLTVAWFDNADGLGGFVPGPQPLLVAPGAGNELVRLADLDRDGDLDVFTSSFTSPDRIEWIENALAPSPWTHLGGASPGAAGLPALAAQGTLEAGAPLTLAVSDAPASTLMLAWLSFTSAPFDVLGGTLYANPPTSQFLRATDGSGAWTQSVPWPAGIPSDLDFWLQFIVQDGSVPAGLTLSNGVTATTP